MNDFTGYCGNNPLPASPLILREDPLPASPLTGGGERQVRAGKSSPDKGGFRGVSYTGDLGGSYTHQDLGGYHSRKDEDFTPLTPEERIESEVSRPSKNYWQDVWLRLKCDRLALLGLVVIVIILLLAVFGPMLSPYEYDAQDFMVSNEPPNLSHWFGTDMFGRDIFVRVLYGARISLAVGFLASFISLFIGVIYGGVSGFAGGRLDDFMMRIVDIIYSVPMMIYVILLMVVVGPGLKSIFITLGISYWAPMARIVRAEVMRLKSEEFILAARVLGASSRRILLRHLIPNALGSVLVTLTFSIPGAIFTEAFLSFVGLGVSAPMASWGVLCNDAASSLAVYPYQLFFPAGAISVTILAFNFLGDGLRDALDPKLRK